MDSILLYAAGAAILIIVVALMKFFNLGNTANFEPTGGELLLALRTGKNKPQTLKEKLLHKLGLKL